MDPQSLITGLLGIVLTGVGWWVKNIWAMVMAQQSVIATLQVELARNYAPRQEMANQFERINEKLDEIQREMRKP